MSRLLQALSDLGNTMDAVAATLRTKGIKGRRRSTCSCPVAKYLLSLGFVGVTVGDEVWVGDTMQRTPEAVCEFIATFDGGGYPDLDAELPIQSR